MDCRIRIVTMSLSLMTVALGLSSAQGRTERLHNSLEFNNFLFSIDYANNANTMGIFGVDVKQPSFSPAAAFYSEWGTDFSFMANFTGNSDDSLENYTSELELILGHTLKPWKKLTLYPSYSHFFYSNNTNGLKSLFSDDIRLDIDFTHDFLSIGASAGYLMGRQNTFYATASNSYLIDIGRFPFRKSTLSISPGIDVNFGSYEYLNLYYIDKLKEEPGIYFFLFRYPAIRQYAHRQKVLHPELTYKDILDKYLREKAVDSFKLTSLNLNLPVYLIFGNFGITLGLYLFIPITQPDYMSDESLFFFNIELSYNLTLQSN